MDVQASSGAGELLECVINVSEGRDRAVIDRIAAAAAAAGAAGAALLDVHTDPDHHRSVFTLAGAAGEVEATARAVARAAVELIDVRTHAGVHPRIGSLDVVPFVSLTSDLGAPDGPLRPGPLDSAVAARDRFARWAGAELALPCFLYGPDGSQPHQPGRTLPQVRRQAWHQLRPDFGPDRAHPTAGAAAVGARPVLVAYNLWLTEPDRAASVRVAAAVRGPAIRALGLEVGASVQVSCNLTDPWRVGPGAVFDAVASRVAVARAELVGLVPTAVLETEPRQRWAELGLDPSTTIEARLQQAGLDGGRFSRQRD